ncbi:MAG: 50S ribosomal protein L10 [Cyanobacteria bacterium QS_8_64_29]|nr:MAG: 50S ribosomal protein L10 [Cyanobacteria bacterium QS_8_64_29]
MPRTPESKERVVRDLKQLLSESHLAVVIDYQGLSVAEIGDLRQRLYQSDGACKIAKNTLAKLAVEGDTNWQPLQDLLSGPSAFVVAKSDISSTVKAYQDFQKATKKTELRGGVMDGQILSKAEVEAIGQLPSREALIGQIAGGINALATQLATGINELPASMARGIKAHAEGEGGDAA